MEININMDEQMLDSIEESLEEIVEIIKEIQSNIDLLSFDSLETNLNETIFQFVSFASNILTTLVNLGFGIDNFKIIFTNAMEFRRVFLIYFVLDIIWTLLIEKSYFIQLSMYITI